MISRRCPGAISRPCCVVTLCFYQKSSPGIFLNCTSSCGWKRLGFEWYSAFWWCNPTILHVKWLRQLSTCTINLFFCSGKLWSFAKAGPWGHYSTSRYHVWKQDSFWMHWERIWNQRQQGSNMPERWQLEWTPNHLRAWVYKRYRAKTSAFKALNCWNYPIVIINKAFCSFQSLNVTIQERP